MFILTFRSGVISFNVKFAISIKVIQKIISYSPNLKNSVPAKGSVLGLAIYIYFWP